MKAIIVPLTLIAGIVLAAGATLERIAVTASAKPASAGTAFDERLSTSVVPKSVQTVAFVKDEKPQPLAGYEYIEVTEGGRIWLDTAWAALAEAKVASLKKPSAFACSDGYRKVPSRSAQHYRCTKMASKKVAK